jgi:integrase
MLEFRAIRGYKEETHLRDLLRFDRYCAEHFPDLSELTQTVVHAWYGEETGTSRYLIGKATAIRQFGKYLNAVNEEAYILPDKFAPNKDSFNPYIFTDAEMTALFTAIDMLSPFPNEPFLNEIAPVLFRLTYTCGLRPNESRELLRKNIDFGTGEILIANTKRAKERIVVMSDDMLTFARAYDLRRSIIGGNSPHFFPAKNGCAFDSARILAAFNKAWTMATCTPRNPIPRTVRVYDLRHRFASACLNRWLDNGDNLMNRLPYLRAYMGHNSLNETAYYIHLLPENLVKSSGVDWFALNAVLPEVQP